MIDGWPTETLESYTFDSKGVISGFYSNGQTRTLGQIAVANFANPGGLRRWARACSWTPTTRNRPTSAKRASQQGYHRPELA
jgi:flagellar hook protein FlgE